MADLPTIERTGPHFFFSNGNEGFKLFLSMGIMPDDRLFFFNLKGGRDDAREFLTKLEYLFAQHVETPVTFERRIHPDV